MRGKNIPGAKFCRTMHGRNYFEITNHRNPFMLHSHIAGIYREGVDKYHLRDQLRLSQGIFNKREIERERERQ